MKQLSKKSPKTRLSKKLSKNKRGGSNSTTTNRSKTVTNRRNSNNASEAYAASAASVAPVEFSTRLFNDIPVNIKNKASKEKFESFYKDKTVGIMSGCFCPPHKGHYNSFLQAINSGTKEKYKLDFLFIETTNSGTKSEGSRHGTPVSHTLETLNKWANKIYEEIGTQVFINNSVDPYKSNYQFIPRNVGHVYDISVYDSVPEDNQRKLLDRTAKNFLIQLKKDQWGNNNTRNTTLYNKASTVESERDRTENLSATEFTRCLMNVQQKDTKENRELCSKFINHLSPSERDEYIDSIIQYKLKVKKSKS